LRGVNHLTQTLGSWDLHTECWGRYFRLSLAKIPSVLKSLTFFYRRAMTPTHYEETANTILDHILALQKDLRSRSGEPSASPTIGYHETFEQTPAAPYERPSLLGGTLQTLERLARGFDHGQTRYRSALAPKGKRTNTPTNETTKMRARLLMASPVLKSGLPIRPD